VKLDVTSKVKHEYAKCKQTLEVLLLQFGVYSALLATFRTPYLSAQCWKTSESLTAVVVSGLGWVQ
jgi:hypothetical protein